MNGVAFAIATAGASVTIYRLRHDLGRGRVFWLRPLCGGSDARPRPLVSMPSLDELARDPSAIASLTRPVLLALYQILAPLEAHIRAALLACETPSVPAPLDPDRVVPLAEACTLLAMSADYVYRNWKRLGGFKDDDGRVKFPARVLHRHVNGRPSDMP